MVGLRVHLFYALLVVVGVIASALITRAQITSLADSSVYLIGSVTITDRERLPEYQAIAGPLAADAGGYLPLAFASPDMIEGEPPTGGLYFVERYDSIEGLNAFINSEEFQAAKELRDQVADVHFMMWLPAIPAGSLPH